MIDVLVHLWPWILGCFLAGGATGYFVKRPARQKRLAAWLVWTGLALLAASLAALVGLFAGRAAVWLETGVAAISLFLAGAAGGTLARGGSLREHEGWAVGLIPAGLLWLGANQFGTPDFEAALKKQVSAEIERAGAKVAKIAVDGRDVTITKEAQFDAESLLNRLARLDGVRAVRATVEELGAASDAARPAEDAGAGPARPPAEEAAEAEKAPAGAPRAAAEKAEEAGAEAIRAPKSVAGRPAAGRAAGRSPVAKKADEAAKTAEQAWVDPGAVARKPASPAEAAGRDAANGVAPVLTRSAAAKALAALPKKGELDPATCQNAVAAIVAMEKIQFRTASVSIRPASARALDKIAALLQRCPQAKVEVAGHTDNVGDDECNRDLSQRRADAVAAYLAREGVARGRLTGVGYGAARPIASNADEAGRAENRRIEFIVK